MTNPTAKRKVVLIVEDDPILRMMAVDLVEDAGFEAVEAIDAVEAIEILEARADIRVVFTDVDMPRGMDGMALAALVRARWSPMGLILTSGKINPRPEELPARGVFFSKPYSEQEITSALRQMAP